MFVKEVVRSYTMRPGKHHMQTFNDEIIDEGEQVHEIPEMKIK